MGHRRKHKRKGNESNSALMKIRSRNNMTSTGTVELLGSYRVCGLATPMSRHRSATASLPPEKQPNKKKSQE
ncbi:lipoprotein YlaJ [Anopheles sinensis]|uniref:Lipoprotein YlaJ n=1 Tax=Anopheles sinensis TaxID=74873 RepID=A0A084W6G1_ANOSI|nr:lipoprotein YlaJ [Anopheles sinensis]